MDKAKVFWSGRSQAVRLPKKYRFDADEVTIRKDGESIVLEPNRRKQSLAEQWMWLDEWRAKHGPLDKDFVAAALDRPGLADDDIDPVVADYFK